MLKPWMRKVVGTSFAYLTKRKGVPVYQVTLECKHTRLANTRLSKRLLCYTCRAMACRPRPIKETP